MNAFIVALLVSLDATIGAEVTSSSKQGFGEFLVGKNGGQGDTNALLRSKKSAGLKRLLKRVIADVKTELDASHSLKERAWKATRWLVSKFPQMQQGKIQSAKQEKEVSPPKCDEVCRYVGKLLRRVEFFAISYCTFSTTLKKHQTVLGEKNAKLIKEATEDALSYYNNLAVEISAEEPRIKMENKTQLEENCRNGILFPCGASHENHLYVDFLKLKCHKSCGGGWWCTRKIKRQFNSVYDRYYEKHDEISEEEDDHDEDDNTEDDRDKDDHDDNNDHDGIYHRLIKLLP